MTTSTPVSEVHAAILRIEAEIGEFIDACHPGHCLTIQLQTPYLIAIGEAEPAAFNLFAVHVDDAPFISAENYEDQLRLRAFESLAERIGDGTGAEQVSAIVAELRAELCEPDNAEFAAAHDPEALRAELTADELNEIGRLECDETDPEFCAAGVRNILARAATRLGSTPQ